jgi:hypothetical protein
VYDDSPQDDDLLIEKLRSRAYDPAWRFDEAPVPIDWVVRRYGRQRVVVARRSSFAFSTTGTIYYPAGSPEAVEYYRDTPRCPPYPPATMAEVEDAERLIGHRLPELLRRLYTEVANGGFGPDARGFASITDGYRAPEGGDGPSAVWTYLRDRREGLPVSWFELTPGGCSMYWYVSLTEPDNPALLFDADGWDPREQGPEHGVTHVTASLRRWLWAWANGHSVWDEVLAR